MPSSLLQRVLLATLIVAPALGASALAQGQAPGVKPLGERRSLPVITNPFLQLPVDHTSTGLFQIAPQANTGNVWVLNTSTGALRICLPPDEGPPGTPQCYPWGDATATWE